MQREIKFRGKRVDNGEWVYGSLLQSEIDVNQIAVKCAICQRFAHDYNISQNEVIPESVGQFTGLKDILGKEIWEGDIIHCLKKGMQFGAVEQVEFKRGCFILRHRDIPVSVFEEFEDFMDIVVVGNIYENPELLTH